MSTPSTFKIKGAFTFVASGVLFPSACWWAETLAVPKFDAEIEIVERGRLLDSEGPKGGDEIVIITVESVFTPRAGSRLASRDIDNFELVFSRLTACLKETRFRQKCTKHSATLICWSLYDRDKPYRPQMNRWVLPVPQNPIKNSIESLEMVLYNFVCLSQLKVNNSHSLCPKGAILDCNEAQLHQLSEKNALLDRLIEDFRHRYPTHDNAIIQTLIKEKIATVESTVTCLLTLVSFIENNYGRATPAQGVWNKVKSFIRGPFTTLAIDNPQLEIIKDNIRREMTALQRAAPILAAHIRLLDPDARKDFFGALKDAGDVAMKHEMLRKLAIVPQYLNDAEKRVDHMRRVKEYYDKVAARLLAEIEALNKLVGEEYMLHGDAMFNLQGPLGRFGGRKPRVNTLCAVEDCYPRCSLDWSEDWSEKI